MRVTANLATHERRVKVIEPTIRSLACAGFSAVRVWLNDCQPPAWSKNYPFVIWHMGEDRADGGKFGFLESGEYYCTCDDDIIYPPDYSEKIVKECNASDGVVSYHGHDHELFPVSDIYIGASFYGGFTKETERRKITIPGSGVACIDTSRVSIVVKTEPKRMIDVHFAIACKEAGITPMLGAKPSKWLKPIHLPGGIFGKPRAIETALLNAAFTHR